MNKYLNVYLPYERNAWHEDQLTRAAMVLMRLVPAALDAFLAQAACPPASQLPEIEFDMQTALVQREPGPLRELVSVFLTPDAGAGAADDDVADAVRGQRLDGVLRFDPELVVVIESKVREGASDWQSRHLHLAGATPDSRRRRDVRWHSVIDAWMALRDGPEMDTTARLLLDDFHEFANTHFSHVMPYRTLRLAAGDDTRVARRLRAILTEATGLTLEPGQMHAMLPETKCLQRAELKQDDNGSILLMTWAAELVPQAKHLYRSEDRIRRLLAVAAQPGWRIDPNPHLAFFRAAPERRAYFSCQLPPLDYLNSWSNDNENFGRYPRDEVEAPDFWQWLLDTGYAHADDRERFDEVLSENQSKFDLRPSVQIIRGWSWEKAQDVDDEEARFAAEVRVALDQVLTALDEPSVRKMGGDGLPDDGR